MLLLMQHPSIPHKFSQFITHERLLSLLRYEAESGDFYWRVRRNSHARTVRPGDRVEGHINVHGYRIVGLDRHRYPASRLAWFYVHGTWPVGEVDHRDRNPLNNRISNLRDTGVERSLQRANQKVRKDSKLGIKGVQETPEGRYRARVAKREIGRFDTPEEAHAAYMKEAKRIFGEYARSK